MEIYIYHRASAESYFTDINFWCKSSQPFRTHLGNKSNNDNVATRGQTTGIRLPVHGGHTLRADRCKIYKRNSSYIISILSVLKCAGTPLRCRCERLSIVDR